jgi:hypothetical protein
MIPFPFHHTMPTPTSVLMPFNPKHPSTKTPFPYNSIKLVNLNSPSTRRRGTTRNSRTHQSPPIPPHSSPAKPVKFQSSGQLFHLPLRALIASATNTHTSKHGHTLQHASHRLRNLVTGVLISFSCSSLQQRMCARRCEWSRGRWHAATAADAESKVRGCWVRVVGYV